MYCNQVGNSLDDPLTVLNSIREVQREGRNMEESLHNTINSFMNMYLVGCIL
jgi:hypothetical protein